jgi:hypothetical protein
MQIADELDLFDGLNLNDDPEEKKPAKKKSKAKAKVVEPVEEPEPEKPKKKKKESKALSEQDSENQQKLLMALNNYASSPRLGPYLKTMGFKNLTSSTMHKKSIAELESLVARVRFCANNKTNANFQDQAIKSVMDIGEKTVTASSRGKINIIGTTDECFRNEEWLDLLEQVKIEYLSFATMSLPVRFGLSTASIAMMVNSKKNLAKVQSENADLLAAPTEEQKSDLPPPQTAEIQIPDFKSEPEAKPEAKAKSKKKKKGEESVLEPPTL